MTGVERVADALLRQARAQREYRERTDEILDAPARHRRPPSAGEALRDVVRTSRDLRDQHRRRPRFDPGPLVEMVAEERGGDPRGAENDLYRTARHLEFLAGARWFAFETEGEPPLPDDLLAGAAELLAAWLLEPLEGPMHRRLRGVLDLWRAVERGRLLALRSGASVSAPWGTMKRVEARAGFMRLPEARRELLQEWRRLLGT